MYSDKSLIMIKDKVSHLSCVIYEGNCIILAEQFEIQEQDLVNTKNSEPTKHLIIKEHLRVV